MNKEPAYSPANVGRRIKVIRAVEGISQAKFAERIGVGASTVGNWEQGRARPSEQQIETICDQFSVTSDYIVLGNTFGLMHGIASKLDLAERRLSNT